MAHLPNYLRSHRKRLALSQNDVAYLLGASDGTKVCRYERFVRVPSLETALALVVVLQKPARELFVGTYQKAERGIVARAQTLLLQIDRTRPTGRASRKRQTLVSIINPISKNET